MYSCTMPVPEPGVGGLGARATPLHSEKAVSVLFSHYMSIIMKIMVWGGLGCFNGPHDGYANRSNWHTSLPRAIGSPTDSQTVFAPHCTLTHDIWYPARCSAMHKKWPEHGINVRTKPEFDMLFAQSLYIRPDTADRN